MFSWINDNDIYSTPPTIHHLTAVNGLCFVKPQAGNSPDPWLVVEVIAFEGDALNSMLPY
jgi:hypothetical protein